MSGRLPLAAAWCKTVVLIKHGIDAPEALVPASLLLVLLWGQLDAICDREWGELQ